MTAEGPASRRLAQVEYLLLLAGDLGYLPPDAAETIGPQVAGLARWLRALRAKVERGA
ncbi:MAG: hypothetical protein GYA57_09310 [Myxococcales bacterium]|nr:hypothetical protein [Myxococcales bacterium]